MRSRGNIRLGRKMFDGQDPIWNAREPFDRRSAWVDLIQYAEWRKRSRMISGRVVALERGEFLASVRFLAKRWGWGAKKVRLFLSALLDMGRISTQRETHAGTVYLLVNYARYQATPKEKGTGKGASGAQTGHKPEEREDRGDKSPLAGRRSRVAYTPEFLAAWDAYPKRVGDNPKPRAFRAWNGSLERGATPEELQTATRHYAEWLRTKGKVGTEYVKQAATFYGPDEPWREYLEPMRAPKSAGSSNPWVLSYEDFRERMAS